MKTFILSALLPFLYLLYSLFPACAPLLTQAQSSTPVVGGYACVLSDNVFFYSERDEKRGVFLLPKTYYVKLLDVAPDYCKIEYLYDDNYVQKLVGYAKTNELTFVDYVPKRPYLYRLIEVSYRIDNALSTTSSVLDEIKVTCAYYGDYTIGSQVYCYILRDGVFGYIPKPEGLSYDENTEYAEWLKQTQNTPADEPLPDETTEPASPAQIAILVAVCLLVPVLAALILRSSKRHPLDNEDE